jgi:hypothetical protein
LIPKAVIEPTPEEVEVEELPVEDIPLPPPPVEVPKPKSVMIVDKPREAMIGQSIPVFVHGIQGEFGRVGVDRTGGSLFHCIIRATYPPYGEWNRERRIRKVKEFRQDLSVNFEGYYLRLDQREQKWPPLAVCKREIENVDGCINYDYLEYIGKIINKSIVILSMSDRGVVNIYPGTRVYAKTNGPTSHVSRTKTNSPITYMRAESVYMFIIHLGGPAYELLGMKKDGGIFTLFPESHVVVQSILKSTSNS